MGTYDTDILSWSETQGALLDRIAGDERVNSDELDWTNIGEEVESVGRSEVGAVQSQLDDSATASSFWDGRTLCQIANGGRNFEAFTARSNVTTRGPRPPEAMRE